jgi:hypothetical protein
MMLKLAQKTIKSIDAITVLVTKAGGEFYFTPIMSTFNGER